MNSQKRVIRVNKEDSAFVYSVLESYEGVTSYSTLSHEKGVHHRDLLLQFTPDHAEEVNRILNLLGDIFYELDINEPDTQRRIEALLQK